MSDQTLPQPLTPSDCDLRGLEWMPLYGHRLFSSDFDAHADDAAFRVGLSLWWAAWNQVPAASLPDDEVALCRLAGLGRDLESWRRVRERALHGFVPCGDGRFYHRALAQLALSAWDRRLKDRARKAKWKARSQGEDAAADVCGTHERRGDETTGDDRRGDESSTPAAPPAGERRSANGLRRVRVDDVAMAAALREATGGGGGKRMKRQDLADRDMIAWLAEREGLDRERAWQLVSAARDPLDAEHVEAARYVEGVSRAHRLGWFAGEAAA